MGTHDPGPFSRIRSVAPFRDEKEGRVKSRKHVARLMRVVNGAVAKDWCTFRARGISTTDQDWSMPKWMCVSHRESLRTTPFNRHLILTLRLPEMLFPVFCCLYSSSSCTLDRLSESPDDTT